MLCGAALVCLTIFAWLSSTDGLECYTCSNVTLLKDCTQIASCSDGSACYMNLRRNGTAKLLTLGCTAVSNCPTSSVTSTLHNSTGGPASLVGRSVTSSDSCDACCETNNCNRGMCQRDDPQCVDTADCASMGAIVNICLDTSHTSCRRFCGLCNMTDGGWSSWTALSSCDVSCGNGSNTRMRTCTNPKPADGGEDCVGQSLEMGTCQGPVCPVHGGWSQWSPWGSCSSSCDIGLQRRDRSCSQPYPAHNGDQCYGDSRDDRICLPGACADGDWSAWGPWSACSASCEYGTRSRSRACNNPAPSMLGRACSGDTSQTELCFTRACHDGDWSAWGSWSVCSTSRGYGTSTRSRACNNPAPSLVGKACSGDPSQTQLCFTGVDNDGQWSSWGPWETCRSMCGGSCPEAYQYSYRICNNPPPSVRGNYCVGSSSKGQYCHI